MSYDPETTRLLAVTRPLAEQPNLVALADPEQSLLWIRGDRGCVGIGEVLRLTFSGEKRFSDAAHTWRTISAKAHVDDPVQLPGSGLVALGTFTFDDVSATESVLIVPRILVARHRDTAWVTEIRVLSGDGGTISEPVLPSPADSLPWSGADLTPVSSEVDVCETGGVPAHVSLAAYANGVRKAVTRIDRGEVEKIVLARQITGWVNTGEDLRVPLARLAERFTDCWTFAVDGLIGSSPETLIRSTGGAVSARVLAGTRRRHPESPTRDARARNELFTSSKEQREHAFAVLSVVTALSPHVRDLHTSEEPFALQLPNVWHLATDLGASIRENSSALELVGAVHPTAAVAGTPTREAVDMIRELEPFDRGRYAGAVGWVNAAGDGEWVIALRCAQLGRVEGWYGKRSVVASAGGGIVAGSDPAHELSETVSKFAPIVDAFAP